MESSLDKYILRLDSWKTPATNYPEKEEGGYRIHHTRYSRGVYDMNGIDGFVFFKAVKPLSITTLQQFRGEKWHNWMVDDPPHWRAMEIYAEQSKGKVLTTGLGLGLILQAMKGNRNIESITVVEQSEEVVRLIEPHLPSLPEFVIILGDFYDFIRQDNTSWDTIIVDLWVSHGKKQKLDIYYHNVIPTAVDLRMRYPKASITFHGFITVSDIKFASKEMVDLILKIKKEQYFNGNYLYSNHRW